MPLGQNYISADTLQYAGDVNIERATLVSASGVHLNIKQQIIKVMVYEDLFSPFITGKIILKDSNNLQNVFPLIGEERIKLKLTTPGYNASIEDTFALYKMSDKVDAGKKSVAYELNFISSEAINDQNIKNSKVYSGKISDIVGRFVKDGYDGLGSKKPFKIEATRNTIKYVSCYWGPIKNLTYLTENAISQTQSPSFLFFENRDGFNFRSLESLYQNNAYQHFVQDDYTRDSFPQGGNILNSAEDFKRINKLTYKDNYNYIDRCRTGMYASKLISYDSTKKTYTVKNFDLTRRYENQVHLNSNKPFTENVVARSDAMKIIFPRAFETFTNFGDTTNARIVQERVSFLKLAENQKIEISVLGRFDYTVGQCVNITTYKKRPAFDSMNKEDMVDKMVSGKYLVSAMVHEITTDGHNINMELIKDSYSRKV